MASRKREIFNRRARSASLVLLGWLVLVAPATLRADPGEAGRLAEAARQAARADQNAESARLFERAIGEDSARRMEWLREFADQLTYSGQSERAIPLYREFLASDPAPEQRRQARRGLALALSWNDQPAASLQQYEKLLRADPDDPDALLGKARVLSWMDRNAESRRVYRRVLQLFPDNREALRSLGRVQSWRGRQRDAQQRLRAYLEVYPEDDEAIFLLAQSEYWMGRPDQARQILTRHLERAPQDQRAQDLLAQIEFNARPAARLDYQESHQSDSLIIRRASLEQNFYFEYGRTTIGPRYQFYHYDPQGGEIGRITVQRPGLYARWRLSDAVEATAYLFADFIDPDRDLSSRTRLTFDTYLTWWPGDLLRFDFGLRRETFDNVQSLAEGITATSPSVSMDVSPDELTRFSLRAAWGDYSDGNERLWGQFEAERRVWNQPRILLGWRTTAFKFSSQLDNGYFNPDSYLSNVLTGKAYGQITPRLFGEVSAAAGLENVDPDGSKFIWDAYGRLVYQLTSRLELEARYSYFSSATGSSSGFDRGTAGIALIRRW